MNYIKEMNAFYDWLEINELSPSAINLWYALMHINNKAGWAETFTVAESVLCVKTGLTDRTLRKVRNELKQKGRVDFVSRKGKAPIYKITSFYSTENISELTQRSEINSVVSSEVSSAVSAELGSEVSSTLIKLNKTKQKEDKEDDNNARVNPFAFFEQEGFGTISGFTAERIGYLIDDYSEESVIAAMKEAVLHGARNLKYVEAVLKNPNKDSGTKRRGKVKNVKGHETSDTFLNKYDFGTRFG